MSLRLIVAIALVATALSAPTWTKQLGMLATTSTGAAVTNNCHCDDCKDPFQFHGGEVLHPHLVYCPPGLGPPLMICR